MKGVKVEVLNLQPQPQKIDAVVESLGQRLLNTTSGWWTPAILTGVARRSIYNGRPQKALDTIDQFAQLKGLHGVAALVYRQMLNDERHQFIRAVALADLDGKELDRKKEAHEAFLRGWEGSRSAPPLGLNTRGIIGKYLFMRNSQRWAVSALTAKGIPLSKEAIRP